MSKITNDGLTWSDTGLLYSCTHMATVSGNGLKLRLYHDPLPYIFCIVSRVDKRYI